MKKICFVILLISGMLTNLQAQEDGVEKSIFGIQAGFLGVWVHNEARLGNQFVLRSEIGLTAAFFSGFFDDHPGFILAPVVMAEPRWYYNFNKRVRKEKNIVNNSANFLTARLMYHPDLFIISDYNVQVDDQIAIIPKWGMKRSIGNHVTYELGAGVGYMFLFDDNPYSEEGEVAVDLHVRIGYTF